MLSLPARRFRDQIVRWPANVPETAPGMRQLAVKAAMFGKLSTVSHTRVLQSTPTAADASSTGSILVLGWPERSPAQAPLRTVRESFPAYGSSLFKIRLGGGDPA